MISSHDTLMTGRLPRPQPWSSGRYLQPPAVTQASHSANSISNLPTANHAILTVRCGPSSLNRSASLAGDPIMNSPAGTTTISGHSGQSLKVSFGFRQRISLSTWASVPSHREGERVAIAVCEGLFAGTGTGTLSGAATFTSVG